VNTDLALVHTHSEPVCTDLALVYTDLAPVSLIISSAIEAEGIPMAARTRWRRKLTVGDLDFLWYVAEDRDGMGRVLHLFTPDKGWALQYWLARSRGYPSASVLVASVRGVRHFVQPAPHWPACDVATPGFVRQVAEWFIEAFGVGSDSLAEPRAPAVRGPTSGFPAVEVTQGRGR
jgi:hypothetical protein